MNIHSPVVRALSYMLMATLLLSGMHVLVRYLSADLHPFVVVFFRNLFGLIVLVPLLMKNGITSLATKQPRLYALRIAIGLCAMLSWFYALSKVPVANATALSFSSTIFATLSAWIFLREPMRVRRWAAIVVGLIGVLVVLRPGIEGFNRYALLVIASAATWGLSITIVKQLSKTDHTITIVAWMSIGLSLLSIWPAILVWQWPDATQILLLLLVGALASGGHFYMTNAVRIGDMATVMSVDFFRLIWAAIFGYLLFADVLDAGTVLGAAIIFASAWYIVMRETKLEKESTTH
ncbi:MAG: DMT family transporter [Pseudomonadota bacterium]